MSHPTDIVDPYDVSNSSRYTSKYHFPHPSNVLGCVPCTQEYRLYARNSTDKLSSEHFKKGEMNVGLSETNGFFFFLLLISFDNTSENNVSSDSLFINSETDKSLGFNCVNSALPIYTACSVTYLYSDANIPFLYSISLLTNSRGKW